MYVGPNFVDRGEEPTPMGAEAAHLDRIRHNLQPAPCNQLSEPLRGIVQNLIEPGESLRAVFQPDLDDRLRYCEGLVVLLQQGHRWHRATVPCGLSRSRHCRDYGGCLAGAPV